MLLTTVTPVHFQTTAFVSNFVLVMFPAFPVTLTCSYAFMLEVATPPNAIVGRHGGIPTLTMIKVGIFMNMICVITTVTFMNTFGKLIFNERPDYMIEENLCPAGFVVMNATAV